MRKVKRFGTILGTLLIAAVFIISGSAVAPWVDHYEPGGTTNCTNPGNAVGAQGQNGDATVGVNVPDPTLGILLLDLGAGNEMGANQLFTVYGYSGVNNIYETYNITIYVDVDLSVSYGPYNGWDSADLGFYTPPFPLNPQWRYYGITGTSGLTSHQNQDDTIYGPEIDAVGWS